MPGELTGRMQANVIARFMEGYMAAVFDNFQAGKNAKSSLVKGEVSFFFWISREGLQLMEHRWFVPNTSLPS
jgi:hypothetical protein